LLPDDVGSDSLGWLINHLDPTVQHLKREVGSWVGCEPQAEVRVCCSRSNALTDLHRIQMLGGHRILPSMYL